jgi:hypothetical protein
MRSRPPLQPNLGDQGTDDVVFKREDLPGVPLELVGPDYAPPRRLDEAHVDGDAIRTPTNATLDNGVSAKLARQLGA